MSDEQQDLNLEDVGAGAEDVAAPRRGGLLSGMLLNILKWVAIGIGVIIIVVTTTVLTFRVLNKGNSQNLATVSPEYTAQAKPLANFDNIDQIRGQTADETPAVFLLQVSLGYDPADKEVSVEIGERAREIQDLILKNVSQKRAAELSTTRYDELQAELMTQINTLMRTGKVKKVMFRQFVVQK
jgi:flagellar protein FliL